ncbi:MAG: LytTR family DNA-binding domain-containing protein [Spirosomataceae bacterium]
MTCLLIDDEEIHRKGLRKLLGLFCPEIQIIGEATSFEEGKRLLYHTAPDLVFLDIMLGDGTGLELLKSLPDRHFQVILVSAHDQFAIEAFRYAALDYLLKPIDVDDLQNAVKKAEQQIKSNQTQVQLAVLRENLEKLTAQNRKMVLRDADTIYVVMLSDIVFCKAEGSYTLFKLMDEREILVSKNLGEYEKLLENAHFIRAHHSYIINLNRINKFDKTDGGQLIMHGGSVVPVAVRKREAIFHALNQFLQ